MFSQMLSTNSSVDSAAEIAEQLLVTKARAVDITYSKFFAVGISTLIAIYTIINWSMILSSRVDRSEQTGLVRSIAKLSGYNQWLFKGFVIGGKVAFLDRIMLALLYFGFNLTLMFTNVDIALGTMFAKRCGWLTLYNLCLVVFLGLKNTPLSLLAGRSYESVNILHRCCGFTTILLMMLHALNVIAGLAKEHLLTYLMEPGQYAGIVGAFGLLMIGISTHTSFRKRKYEFFYALHVALVTMVLIAGLLHVRRINWTAIIIVVVAASFWLADRSLRFVRWIYYGTGNHCTLFALPENATRVVMQRSLKATPGSHVFLWIPSIRKLQAHPFTLVSNDPAEFVVFAKDGFTRALHKSALQDSSRSLRASIEGPYGNLPETKVFDKVLLVSGGSGITFNMAVAMNWLKDFQNLHRQSTLCLVWTMKRKSQIRCFENELIELQHCASIDLQINITEGTASKCNALRMTSTASESDNSGKKAALNSSTQTSSLLQNLHQRHHITYGRPDVNAVIKTTLDGLSPASKVLVTACGPPPLLHAVKLATRACISVEGPRIQLHIE